MAGIIGLTKRKLDEMGLVYFENDGFCDQPFCFKLSTGRATIETVSSYGTGSTAFVDGCTQHMKPLVERKIQLLKDEFEVGETKIYRLDDTGKDYLYENSRAVLAEQQLYQIV